MKTSNSDLYLKKHSETFLPGMQVVKRDIFITALWDEKFYRQRIRPPQSSN